MKNTLINLESVYVSEDHVYDIQLPTNKYAARSLAGSLQDLKITRITTKNDKG